MLAEVFGVSVPEAQQLRKGSEGRGVGGTKNVGFNQLKQGFGQLLLRPLVFNGTCDEFCSCGAAGAVGHLPQTGDF